MLPRMKCATCSGPGLCQGSFGQFEQIQVCFPGEKKKIKIKKSYFYIYLTQNIFTLIASIYISFTPLRPFLCMPQMLLWSRSGSAQIHPDIARRQKVLLLSDHCIVWYPRAVVQTASAWSRIKSKEKNEEFAHFSECCTWPGRQGGSLTMLRDPLQKPAMFLVLILNDVLAFGM